MASVATPPPPLASPAQEKASRNKRKYRADSPSTEVSPFAVPYTLPDCMGFEFFSADKATTAAAGTAATATEGASLEHFPNACDMCNCHHATAELLECQRDVSWGNPNEAQLEEILLRSLESVFDNVVDAITAMGYSEAAVRTAVVQAGTHYCWREGLAGFREAVVEMLKNEADMLPKECTLVEDLKKLPKTVLTSIVAVVTDAQPFLTVGDAMFCLLMSDLNVASVCSGDNDFSVIPTVSAEMLAQQVAASNQADPCSSSSISVSIPGPEPSIAYNGTLSSMLPSSQNSSKTDLSAVLGIPNLPNGKLSVAGNMQCVISNLKPNERPVALPDCLEDQPFVAAATDSLKDDKPIASKRGMISSSKRDSSHRQKSTNFEKNFRALGSKGSLRSCKHSSSGSLVLDRKCKSLSDSTGVILKGSSKVSKMFAASMTHSEVAADLSFTAALSSSPSFDAKPPSNTNRASATNAELSLCVPSTTDDSAPSLNQDSAAEVANLSSQINLSYDNGSKDWFPQDRKDKIAMMLVRRQEELQIHMQDWTDWAQQKVMLVARRLGKEKEELQSLRKEKEEVERLQEERHNLEESTRKKLLEMESAISKATAQVERANAAARRLEAENAQLSLQMEAAKRWAAESAANCEVLSRKEENTLKRFQSWVSQRALLQEECAAEKNKLCSVQQQLEHAKEQKDQLQMRSQQEEVLKNEAIARVTSERKQRERIETSARAEENLLLVKAENDMQRYKNEIRSIEQQISQLKVSLDSPKVAAPRWGTDNKSYASRLSEGRKNSNAQILAKIAVSQDLDFDDIQRDRECVMCLSEEMSVVFLPCAHQVVCTKCNDLHEKQGMKECPSCRTPIQCRVCTRSADC